MEQQSVRGSQYLKNYCFDYTFGPPWGNSSVTFTSVAGHLISQDFPARYKQWSAHDPAELFHAPIEKKVDDDKKAIAENIKTHARRSDVLFIWTDCDREGENIGAEIRDVAFEVNNRLQVKRAHFSNIERAYVIIQPIKLCLLIAPVTSYRPLETQ